MRPSDTNILADPLFTVAELCAYLKLGRHRVAKMFRDEPGCVVLVSHPKKRTASGQRRGYKIVRIPESVIRRVLARRTEGA